MSLFGDIIDVVNDIADNVLGVEVDVIHEAWIGQTGYGTGSYAPPVTRRAIVIQQIKQLYTQGGQLITTKAYIGFIGPVPDTAPNAGQERFNPVDTRDTLTLPDGTTGVIVLTGGLLNPDTGRPFLVEVYLADAAGAAGAVAG